MASGMNLRVSWKIGCPLGCLGVVTAYGFPDYCNLTGGLQ